MSHEFEANPHLRALVRTSGGPRAGWPPVNRSSRDTTQPFAGSSAISWKSGLGVHAVHAAALGCATSKVYECFSNRPASRPLRTPLARHRDGSTRRRLRRRDLHLSQRSSASTRRSSPLRGSKRLHQLSKRWADSREFWGLAGSQALGEFMKYDADLWRMASADKGLEKSALYCFQQ